ncbi:ABC transporter substrate-binding protein [Microvirga arsenatis]|uniref:ABC transporter substrate-binding protein n=1 Tax=Microvirga arsenatis TaxID=2692265 RepID=A0ABW9Z0V2_9HYPH|nr:ABC transporter substrate-binding protein [Microvirga arsenatis]NBJ11652.1 ABC transporter substrate-binding protein [Microvirga arsenatis]NBJ24933.1 ABC transporter substrate-binding protein [Microvirga arsenatis]
MERRTFLIGTGVVALSAGLSRGAFAQSKPEKSKVALGVGGKPLLYYLPLTIAERKGFFKDEGLEVEINDFGGGAKSLQALIGGSVDIVTGAYEHTIRMQAKGQDIRAITELGRFPAIVIAAKKDKAGQIKSAADFKGLKIGVTAPGSSTALTAQYAMVKAGLKPTDAAFIGVGSGASAVAAMQKGEIDVISHLDPVISKLESDGDISILIDTRTEAGTRALFGGSNPAATLYTKKDFIDANPVTTQRLVNALMKSLKWLQTAKPEDVAATVPPEYHLGDRPLYLKAVQNSLESYSRDGIVPPDGMKSVMDMLKQLDPELKDAKVDLSATFDGRFVKQAAS